MFNQIGIAGLGLIGGSLAKAIRKKWFGKNNRGVRRR